MTRHCHYCGATDALVCHLDPAPRPGSVARYHAQARCLGCGLSGPLAGAMTPGEAQRSAWLLWDGLPARLAQTSAPTPTPTSGRKTKPLPSIDEMTVLLAMSGLQVKPYTKVRAEWAAHRSDGTVISDTIALSSDDATRRAYLYLYSDV